MRIRKHAKIAAIYSHSSAYGVSTHTQLQCQLNQSPWDVMTFPPADSSSPQPPFQVDGDDSFNGNGSFGDSIGAVESVASLKISLGEEDNLSKREKEEEEENVMINNNNNNNNIIDPTVENRGIIFCCKTNGRDWRCKREAKIGHSMCDHHLKNQYSSAAKKPEIIAASSSATTISRRGRPKKGSAPATNPYEFYYYSGFGPRWGKKRGTGVEPSSKNGSKAEDIDGSLVQIDNGDFDFVDYEDDDDDEDDDGTGKKRGRKPIKARSLKSLM